MSIKILILCKKKFYMLYLIKRALEICLCLVIYINEFDVLDKEVDGIMFMFDNVKQSIYRFRHAEPTLFIEKYKQFQADPSTGYRIDLARNFRSRKEVLTGANYVFKQVFDEALGEIDY